jgi:ATP-dependent exoDNAse (exonuclease V) beta subunit
VPLALDTLPLPNAAAGSAWIAPAADAGGTERIPVTRWLTEAIDTDRHWTAGVCDRTIGTLVHRLFQFEPPSPRFANDGEELAHARTLLRPEERAGLEDVDTTVTAALEAWRSMRLRGDVAALLASGRRLNEVPFSLRVEPTSGEGVAILRGTIDCLIQRDDGAVAVVEFKSGRRRPSHQQQLDLYVEAARRLFPGLPVEGHLIYPE